MNIYIFFIILITIPSFRPLYIFINGRKKSNDFYLEYEVAIKIVHKLNIKSNGEWRRWCKNKPEEFIRIPSSPDKVYKKDWINWFEWLGK